MEASKYDYLLHFRGKLGSGECLSLKQWLPNLTVDQNHPGSLLKITESESQGWGPRVLYFYKRPKGFAHSHPDTGTLCSGNTAPKMPHPGETGCSEPPPQTHLVRKSSADRRALSICSTTLALSTVAARICRWKGHRSLVGRIVPARPDFSLHQAFTVILFLNPHYSSQGFAMAA